MCLAIPARITELNADQPDLATVDVGGIRRKVNIDLLHDTPPEVGDWVLIHVGFALNRISEEEAQEQLRILSLLGESDAALEEVHGYAN